MVNTYNHLKDIYSRCRMMKSTKPSFWTWDQPTTAAPTTAQRTTHPRITGPPTWPTIWDVYFTTQPNRTPSVVRTTGQPIRTRGTTNLWDSFFVVTQRPRPPVATNIWDWLASQTDAPITNHPATTTSIWDSFGVNGF